MEFPFGNKNKGFRLYTSLGNKYFRLLEKDNIAPLDRPIVMFGFESNFKIGLMWTY